MVHSAKSSTFVSHKNIANFTQSKPVFVQTRTVELKYQFYSKYFYSFEQQPGQKFLYIIYWSKWYFLAWELVLPFMHEGEIDAVKTEHRFAYGSAGDVERNIPPFQSMEYEIELLEIGDWPCYSEKKDLIQFIANLKERGNYYYGRKELEKAVYVYKRLLVLSLCHIWKHFMQDTAELPVLKVVLVSDRCPVQVVFGL